MSDQKIIIPNAGICQVAVSIIEEGAPVRWIMRKKPVEKDDTGWLFQTELEHPEHAPAGTYAMIDYNWMCRIDPVAIAVWDFPTGCELAVNHDYHGRFELIDTFTDRVVPPELFYTPPKYSR
ncbi:MAG: DUF2185 domain-containing protein [Microbacteriaceae bacterium]|nr:DUF2185 domain-containing protein [Microbacteriaceae bacterium]